jgi:hypothetical protein
MIERDIRLKLPEPDGRQGLRILVEWVAEGLLAPAAGDVI